MLKQIVIVALPIPLKKNFNYYYRSSKDLLGYRVKVSFNGRVLSGIIIGTQVNSHFKNLKPILEILGNNPLFSKKELYLSKVVCEYYNYSLGEFLKKIDTEYEQKMSSRKPEEILYE